MNILLQTGTLRIGGEGLYSKEVAKELGKIENVHVLLIPNHVAYDYWKIKFEPKKEMNPNYKLHIFKNPKNPYYAYIVQYRFAKKLCEKYDIDIIHKIDSITFSQLAFLKKPFFISGDIPTPPKESFYYPKNPKDWIYKKMVKKTLEKANMIFARELELKKLLISQMEIEPEKIKVVPTGVDIKKFNPHGSKIKFSGFDNIILYAGRLDKQKGVQYLLYAMQDIVKEHSKTLLLIVGTGPDYQYFKNLTENLNLERNVKFLGHKENEEMPKYYCSCDLFVLPSLYEPFGLVLVEAMACGKPVISTNRGGPRDIVTKKTGFLVQSKNSQAIRDRITQLIENKKLRIRMGREARKLVEKKYSWSIIAKEIYDEYKNFY